MGRRYSNSTVIKAFSKVKGAGMSTSSENVIGVPHETVRSMLETVKLNAKVDPLSANVNVFYPFRGTELGDLCHKNGWVESDLRKIALFPFTSSILRIPTASKGQIDFFWNNFHAMQSFYSGRHGRMLRYKISASVKEALGSTGFSEFGRFQAFAGPWNRVRAAFRTR